MHMLLLHEVAFEEQNQEGIAEMSPFWNHTNSIPSIIVNVRLTTFTYSLEDNKVHKKTCQLQASRAFWFATFHSVSFIKIKSYMYLRKLLVQINGCPKQKNNSFIWMNKIKSIQFESFLVTTIHIACSMTTALFLSLSLSLSLMLFLSLNW